MTQLEREAEEYVRDGWELLPSEWHEDAEQEKRAFIAGWRACRAAIAKRRWNERLDTFDLANFGEEEAHEQK